MANGNPYDYLSLIAALSSGQSKPTQAGIERLFMPEIGALTGTYYQSPQQDAANDEYLMMQHAPEISRARQLDQSDIRARIVGDIVDRGMNLWDVQNRVEQYAAEAARTNPAYAQAANSKDLKSYAAKIQSEWDSLRAASMRQDSGGSGGSGGAANFFAKSGLPSPDMQYAPEQLAPEFFNKYFEDRVARQEELAKLARQVASRNNAQKYLEPKPAEKKPRFWEIGKILNNPEAKRVYGGPYGNLKGTKDSSGAVEDIRFQNVAKRIVASQDDINYAERYEEMKARQKFDDEVMQLVAEGLTRRAAESGYTPFMNAMMKRAQFVGMGRTE